MFAATVVVEEHDILAYQRDVRAQAREPERRDVDAVEEDLPGVGGVEARQQVGERDLPAPESPTSATVSPDSMENETDPRRRELPG